MMKESLLKIYLERQEDFKKIRAKFPDEDMAGPLLMSPNIIYNDQPLPLLIVGQETNGWHYNVDNLELQMEVYEDFNVGIDYYSSPFWNVTRKVEKSLGNAPYSCAWTNISKFDLNHSRSYGVYESEISKVDNLLLKEIPILKPKVCIFFTGPSFDTRIKSIFQTINFVRIPDYTEREFCRLEHSYLPYQTYRAYHPNYMRRAGYEYDFLEFISNLRDSIQ